MLVTFSRLIASHNIADSVLTLETDLTCVITDGDKVIRINVPANFRTDRASIPAILRSIYPHYGRYTYPAVLHDYLYNTKAVPRKDADTIFFYAMKSTNVRIYTRWLFWLFVRMFGASYYRNSK